MSEAVEKPIGKNSRVRVKRSHLTHLLPYVGQEGVVTDVYAAPELWVKLDSGEVRQIHYKDLELVSTAKKQMAEMVNVEPDLMEPAALDALVRQLCTS